MLPDSLLKDFDAMQARLTELEARDQVSFYLPFVSRSVVQPYSGAGTTTVYDTASAANLTVLQFGFMAFVLTTNDATNYWQMGVIGTTFVNTSAILPNTWTYVPGGMPFTAIGLNTGRIVATINITKVLAPGSLYLVPLLLVTTK